jgi:hypothetical protein
MKISKTGYKKNSKDKNEPALVIPSNKITMKGVDFPVFGVSDTGDAKMMYPGLDYSFGGNYVYELPMAKDGYILPGRYRNPEGNWVSKYANGGDISIPNLSRPAWLDKYQDGSEVTYVTDPNDPRLKDYQTRMNLYRYSQIPNYWLRDSVYDINTILSGDYNTQDILKDYNDNPLELIQRTTNELVGPYGSAAEKVDIPKNKLQSFVNDPRLRWSADLAFPWYKSESRLFNDPNNADAQLIRQTMKNYPPDSYQGMITYTRYPFDKRTARTPNAPYGSKNYWTSPNTQFIEDNINRDALRQVYPLLDDKRIDEVVATSRELPGYATNAFNPNTGHYYSTYGQDNTDLGSWFNPNEDNAMPVVDGIFPGSYPVNVNRGQLKTRGYLDEDIVENIYKEGEYFPIWNKPTNSVYYKMTPKDAGLLPSISPGLMKSSTTLPPNKHIIQAKNTEYDRTSRMSSKAVQAANPGLGTQEYAREVRIGTDRYPVSYSNDKPYGEFEVDGKKQYVRYRKNEDEAGGGYTPIVSDSLPETPKPKVVPAPTFKSGGWLDKYQDGKQVERRDPNQLFFESPTESDTYQTQYSQPEVTIAPNWTEGELERNRLRDDYIAKDKKVWRHWYDKLGQDKDNVTKRANQFAYNKLAKQYLKGDKDNLTAEQRKFIEKSEYANRLQPSIGSRFAEGVTNPGFNLETLSNLAAPFEYPANLVRGAVKGEFIDAVKGQTPSPYFVSSDLAGTSPTEAAMMSGLMDFGVDAGIGALGEMSSLSKGIKGAKAARMDAPKGLSEYSAGKNYPKTSWDIEPTDDPYKYFQDFEEKKKDIFQNLRSPEGRKRLQALLDYNPHLTSEGQYATVDDLINQFETTGFTTRKPYFRSMNEYDRGSWMEDQLKQAIEKGEVHPDIISKIKAVEKAKARQLSSSDLEQTLDDLPQYVEDFAGLVLNKEGNPMMFPVEPKSGFNWYWSGYDKPSVISVGKDWSPYDAPHILEHEWQHVFQKGKPLVGIDDELKKLDVLSDSDLQKRYESAVGPKQNILQKVLGIPPNTGKPDLGHSFASVMKDRVGSKNYFLEGSSGQESAAMASEIRENLFQRGIIKNRYDEITPKMLKDHYNLYRNTDAYNRYPIRVYDIMKDKNKNFNLLSNVLNKMPATVPAIGAGYLGYEGMQEKKYGGWLDRYQDGSQVPANLPWINQSGQYKDPAGVGPTVAKAEELKQKKVAEAARKSPSSSNKLPSGTITPTLGPVEAALMAPVAASSIAEAAPIIKSAMNVPIAGLPGVSAGLVGQGLMDSYFASQAPNQLMTANDNFKSGDITGGIGNTALAAMNLFPFYQYLPKAQGFGPLMILDDTGKGVSRAKGNEPHLSEWQKLRIAEGKPVYTGSGQKGNMTMREIQAQKDLQKAVKAKSKPKKLSKEEEYERLLRESYQKTGGQIKKKNGGQSQGEGYYDYINGYSGIFANGGVKGWLDNYK